MALNIGELFGTIGLDPSNWDRELNRAEGNLQAFGVAGAAIAATAAVAIGAALSKGISDAINVEAGTDKIQAQLGLTTEQSAVAGKAAGSLFAGNYGESIEDVQSSVGIVMSSISGMRDASEADVAAMTAKMMGLSTVMEVDIARASQVAGQMITSGIAVDGVQAADLLAASLQKVPAALREDILDAVDEYGPFMSQLGIKGEEAMGILVNASEKGMYGIDKVGDALKEFTIRSTDMSSATGTAYEALGMNQEQMSADLLAGGATGEAAFAKIVAGLQTMEDPVARSSAALALFGTPLEDLGVNEIPQFLAQIDPMGDAFDSVAGAADKMGQDLASNAASGFGSFKRQAQAALIDFVQVNIMPSVSQFATFLSTTVGPAITELGGWITTNLLPALQAFGGWFAENQGTIALVAGIIGTLLIPVFIRLAVQAGLTAAATAAAWAIKQAGAIKTAAVYVAQSYKMIGSFVSTAASMTVNAARVVAGWVLMGGQALIQGARMAAGWVLAMGPVGWIITAVVGLVALVIANWDKVSAVTSAVWGSIMGALTGFWNNTVGMFRDFWGHITGAASAAWDAVTGIFTAAWGVISGIVGTYIAIVTTIFKTGWEILQTYVATVLAVLIAIFTGQFDKIPAYLASAWAKISGFFMAGVASIDAILGGGITAAVEFFKNIFNTAVAFVMSIPARFMAALAALGQLAVTLGGYIGAAKDALVAKFWEAVAFVASVPQLILTGLAMLGQLAITVGGWILAVKDAAVAKFLELVGFVTSIPGLFMAGLAALGGLAIQMGLWILGMKDAAVTKFGEILEYVTGIPGKILSGLGDLGGLLLDAGGQILQGFLDGLTAGFENVKDFVGGIGTWIADHKGPKAYDLALLVPAGGWIMDGLDRGLQSKMGMLEGTLGNVSSTIASGIQPELAVTGSYAGAGAAALGSTSAGSAGGVSASTVSLHPEDRALLRAVAERGFSVQIGSRVVAEANIEGRKALRLPV